MNSGSYSSEHSPGFHLPALRMFSWAARIVWTLLFCLVVISELAPRPLLAPLLYYSYSSAKALMFILLGFLTPLSFWRFDRLGLGAMFAVGAAGAAELFQSLFEGHRSSLAEFLVKLLLLLIGFACALNARYDRKVGFGRFSIRLSDTHLAHPD
jgi:tryptophan-rich sensory protein